MEELFALPEEDGVLQANADLRSLIAQEQLDKKSWSEDAYKDWEGEGAKVRRLGEDDDRLTEIVVLAGHDLFGLVASGFRSMVQLASLLYYSSRITTILVNAQDHPPQNTKNVTVF